MGKEVPLVIEASWEVCNKVGGIFTVVSSKAATMQTKYGENYILVGPFFPNKVRGIFEEKVAPESFKPAFAKLEQEGIHCVYGNWLVKGEPRVILVDFARFAAHRNEIKGQLWDWHQIDSLNTDYHDFDEPLIWSFAVARLVQEIAQPQTVLHCHEWLAAGALLALKKHNARVGLVFTTHATTLGRSLANSDKPLYEMLGNIDPDQTAREIGSGVLAKHQLEKAAAQQAHTFTTVSEITGLEAEHLLGVKPDVLLYNGLDMEKFPSFEETTLKHRLFKEKIFEFLMYYFFPHYSFDLHHTRLIFLAGRNEIHDKGIDVFIESLGQLNQKLKEEGSNKTVVAFVFVPGPAREVRQEVIENKTHYIDVREMIDDNIEDIKHQIIRDILSKKPITMKTLFDDETQQVLKKKLLSLQKGVCCPPLSTHHLTDEDTNPILTAIRNAGLRNSDEDKVKIIYYPIYLTGADGLLDTNYYESMMACHLGVFPSYYEPWGYTPHEAAALGVPSVTTDLAGFGRYINEQEDHTKHNGIWVLHRHQQKYADIVKELTEVMNKFVSLDHRNRVQTKIAAKTRVLEASWSLFGKRYFDAHALALQRL